MFIETKTIRKIVEKTFSASGERNITLLKAIEKADKTKFGKEHKAKNRVVIA